MGSLEDYRNLKIDDSDLTRELSLQAAKFLYVAEMAVNVEAQYELYKQQVEELTAALDKTIRDKAAEDGVKVTEAGIGKEIERHPEYVKAKKALISKRLQREMMKALRESWYMRKDLLIQMAIKQRAEMESLASSTVRSATAGSMLA